MKGYAENNCVQENIAKKIKSSNARITSEIPNTVTLPAKAKLERCTICRQFSDSFTLYNGHPNNSVEEYIALTDEKLSLFSGEEPYMSEQDCRPTHKVYKITLF